MAIETALPLIGHIYHASGWQAGATWNDAFSVNHGAFVRVVGPFTNYPTFKMTSKGTHQQITLYLPVQDRGTPAIPRGGIITLTEQGGDGSILYTGIINDIGETLDATTSFPLVIDPIGVEASLTPYEHNYNTNTDPAQMVRDAVSQTTHLTWTTASVPLGLTPGQYDFSLTGTVLQVLQKASQLAGANVAWFIDEQGVVWFGTQSTASASYTAKRGQDYTARVLSQSIEKQYNYLGFIGGTPPHSGTFTTPNPIATVYDDGHIVPGYPLAAPSYAKSSAVGLRARMPHFRIPKLLDQTTLNNIATTIGTQLNRPQTKIELTLRNFARIDIKSSAGRTMRYWDPNANSGLAEGDVGSGGYSPIYLIEDIERAGNIQKVSLTDLIQDETDLQYQIDQMVQAAALRDSTTVGTDSGGVITPGMVVGATGGGPLVPTVPSFYP